MRVCGAAGHSGGRAPPLRRPVRAAAAVARARRRRPGRAEGAPPQHHPLPHRRPGRRARLSELHAAHAAAAARRRRGVPARVRDDAHVLPVALQPADRHVRAQPPRLHQQRQLLLAAVAGQPRDALLRHVPLQRRIPHRLLRQVPEQVQRQLHPARLARVGRPHHELALLQLLHQPQRQAHQARRRLPQGLLPGPDRERLGGVPAAEQAVLLAQAGDAGAELPRAARPRGLGAAVLAPLLQRHHPPHAGLRLRAQPGQAVDPARDAAHAAHPPALHRHAHDQAAADAAERRRGRRQDLPRAEGTRRIG